MPTGAITSGIDVASLTVYAFWFFFVGLVFYLRREDRREGYPLEADTSGRLEDHGLVWVPGPKQYAMADGSTVTLPTGRREPMKLAARRMEVWPGSPIIPTGDPMLDGVGPAAYPKRPERPAAMVDGTILLVPLRADKEFSIATEDRDPRGFKVVGCDGVVGGVITDAWVDRSELILRYYEVEVTVDNSKRHVLLPMTFCDVQASRGVIKVEAIRGDQFATVPATGKADQVTMQEEDRITAYYAGGTLYATPDRAEPWI